MVDTNYEATRHYDEEINIEWHKKIWLTKLCPRRNSLVFLVDD